MEDLEVRLVAGRMLRRGRDSQGRVGDQWRTARSLDEDEEELTMENGRTAILMLSQTHQLGPVYQYKLLHGKQSLGIQVLGAGSPYARSSLYESTLLSPHVHF